MNELSSILTLPCLLPTHTHFHVDSLTSVHVELYNRTLNMLCQNTCKCFIAPLSLACSLVSPLLSPSVSTPGATPFEALSGDPWLSRSFPLFFLSEEERRILHPAIKKSPVLVYTYTQDTYLGDVFPEGLPKPNTPLLLASPAPLCLISLSCKYMYMKSISPPQHIINQLNSAFNNP